MLGLTSSPPSPPPRWCQHLAGLDFIPALPLASQLGSGADAGAVSEGLDAYRRQQRVVSVLERLRYVKEADAALK